MERALRISHAAASGLRWEAALGWLGTSLAAIAFGAAIAHGTLSAAVLLLGVVVILLVAVFASSRQLALAGLVAWGCLEVVTFPFLNLGGEEAALLTFDRLWIPALAVCLVSGSPRHRRTPATMALVVVAMWFVISFGLRAALTTDGTVTALRIWVDAILLPILLMLAARELVRTKKDVARVLASLLAAGVLLALIGISQFALGYELASLSGAEPRYDEVIGLVRVSGPYGAPEVFAVALLICLASTIAWARVTGRRDRFAIAGIAATLQSLAIGLTFFRAAWLGAAIVVVLGVTLYAGPGRSLRAVAVSLALAGLAVMTLAFGGTEEVGTRLGNEENITGRFATYEQDLNVFSTAPVFGVGVEQFSTGLSPLTRASVSGTESLEQPHSSFLGLLAEQGVVGFLPLLAFAIVVAFLHAEIRQRDGRTDRALAACLLGSSFAYLVMSLTLTMLPYGPSNAFFALVVGIVAGRVEATGARAPVSRTGPRATPQSVGRLSRA